jgi:hypothetical protein
MDVASLTYDVDPKPIEKANEALEQNVKVGSAAERQIIRWANAATDAARKVANENNALSLSVSALDTVYRRLIGTITTLAAGALAAFSLSTFIQSTSEADEVQAQLAATLKATQQVAGQTQAALNEVAEELKHVSIYGDEAVNSAQALLLTFTRIRGDNFEKATKVAVDFATAMKVDLSSAAWTLGRALDNPIMGMNMLRRQGVNLTNEQKTTIKSLVDTGKGAEAQAKLLEILESRYSGSAKAARETLGGALKALGGYFGDAFEMGKESSEPLRLSIEDLIKALQNPAFIGFIQMIGDVLFGVMMATVKAATALAEAIAWVSENMDKLAPFIAAAGILLVRYFGQAALTAIAVGLGTVGSAGVAAFTAIGVAIRANPIGAIVTAITLALTAMWYFRDELSDIFGVDIVGAVKTGVNFLIGSFTAAYEDIKFLWSNFGDIMGAAVFGAVNSMTAGIDAILKYSSEKIDRLIDKANKIAPSWAQIPKIGFEGGKGPMANPYADRLAQNNAAHAARQKDRLSKDYVGDATNWWNKKEDKGGAYGPHKPPDAPDFDPSDDKSKAAEAYQKILDKADAYIAKQKLEAEALGKTALEAARLRNEQDLLNQAKDADLKLSDSQIAQLKEKALLMAQEAENTKILTTLNTAKRDSERFVADQQAEREALFMSAKQANIYRKEREAINKATADGTVLLPEQEEKLKSYARAMAEAENETTALKDALTVSKETMGGFFAEMLNGLRQGMTLWDAMSQAATKALNKIMDKLMTMAIDEAMNSVFDNLKGVFTSASSTNSSVNKNGSVQTGGGINAGQSSGLLRNLWDGVSGIFSSGSSSSSAASGAASSASGSSGGFLSSLFSSGGSSGGGGLFSSISSFFGGSGGAASAASPAAGMAPTGASGLTSAGASGIGTFAGMMGIGMGALTALTAKSTAGTIGGIGQMIGSGLMMIPSPWTMAIGAIISLASTVLPALIGEADTRTHSSTNANLVYGPGGFTTNGGAYGPNANSGASEQALSGAGKNIETIFKTMGGVKDATKVWGMALDSWTAAGKDWSYTSNATYLMDPQGRRQSWKMNDSGMMDTAAAQVALRSIMSGAVGEISDAMKTATQTMINAGSTLQTVADAIKFVTETYEDLGKKMGPAKAGLKEISNTFAEIASRSKGLGLSIEPVTAAQEKATKRFANDFLDSMLSPFQVTMRAFQDQREEALNSAQYIADNVEGVYVDMDAIVQYYTKRQLEVTKEYYAQSVGSLQDAINQLTYGSVSGATPLTQLQGLQTQFEETFRLAKAGDTDSQNNLAQQGLDYVAFAKNFYGGDQRAEDVKDTVREAMATVTAGILKDTGIVEMIDKMGNISVESDTRNRELIEKQAQELKELKESMAQLVDQLKRANVNKVM